MHKKKLFITIETKSKTDFGIEFMTRVLTDVIKVLNQYRKCYSAKIEEV